MLTMVRIIFLISMCAIEATNSATAGEPGSEDPDNIAEELGGITPWWEVHPPNKSAEVIGNNVPVLAHIIYDSAYTAGNRRKKRESESKPKTSDEMKKYFEQLFGQVQEYFKNQSISINVSITSISEMTNLSVSEEHWFKARETLKNVVGYGASLAEPVDTIFYLFTWHRMFKPEGYDPAMSFSTSDAETTGTFCSQNTSAAVIRHWHKSLIYWSTVRATALIFGSKHFASFSTEDRIKMNETFSHCPVRKEKEPPTEEIPSC
uniref:28 kDa Metastriate family member n=1 Tax=Rhipicephalus zambeziensis TaxID=60191 RepID=A0A224Y6S2_9ACAR